MNEVGVWKGVLCKSMSRKFPVQTTRQPPSLYPSIHPSTELQSAFLIIPTVQTSRSPIVTRPPASESQPPPSASRPNPSPAWLKPLAPPPHPCAAKTPLLLNPDDKPACILGAKVLHFTNKPQSASIRPTPGFHGELLTRSRAFLAADGRRKPGTWLG